MTTHKVTVSMDGLRKNLTGDVEALGPEQTAMALERTIHTVMQRACELRKKGLMTKPTRKIHHKRLCSPKAA